MPTLSKSTRWAYVWKSSPTAFSVMAFIMLGLICEYSYQVPGGCTIGRLKKCFTLSGISASAGLACPRGVSAGGAWQFLNLDGSVFVVGTPPPSGLSDFVLAEAPPTIIVLATRATAANRLECTRRL